MTKKERKLRERDSYKRDRFTVAVDYRGEQYQEGPEQWKWYLAIVDDDGYATIAGTRGCCKIDAIEVWHRVKEQMGYPATILYATSRAQAQRWLLAAIEGREIKTEKQLDKAWDKYNHEVVIPILTQEMAEERAREKAEAERRKGRFSDFSPMPLAA